MEKDINRELIKHLKKEKAQPSSGAASYRLEKEFETYQHRSVVPNGIKEPRVFNGMCLIRRYRVRVEEVVESDDILIERLRNLWDRQRELSATHSSNLQAMFEEAQRLGIELRSR